MKIPLETKNKISDDIKNNVNIKEIMNTYNISRATIFRIKKDIINEKVNETVNNESSNNDNETEENKTEENKTEVNNTEEEEEEDKETVNNNFNIE